METELTKKRGRAEVRSSAVKTNRSPALERTAKKGNAAVMTKRDVFSDDCDDLFKKPDTYQYRSLGVFEFPWQKEEGGLALKLEGCSLRDVFFSSLVDGCSATIGFPGDRLSRPRASPIILPASANEFRPSDGDAEDFDYIWSSILRQPLSVVRCIKTSGV